MISTWEVGAELNAALSHLQTYLNHNYDEPRKEIDKMEKFEVCSRKTPLVIQYLRLRTEMFTDFNIILLEMSQQNESFTLACKFFQNNHTSLQGTTPGEKFNFFLANTLIVAECIFQDIQQGTIMDTLRPMIEGHYPKAFHFLFDCTRYYLEGKQCGWKDLKFKFERYLGNKTRSVIIWKGTVPSFKLRLTHSDTRTENEPKHDDASMRKDYLRIQAYNEITCLENILIADCTREIIEETLRRILETHHELLGINGDIEAQTTALKIRSKAILHTMDRIVRLL